MNGRKVMTSSSFIVHINYTIERDESVGVICHTTNIFISHKKSGDCASFREGKPKTSLLESMFGFEGTEAADLIDRAVYAVSKIASSF